MKYPQREPMFAVKFLRLLANSGGAMAVGADGMALLAVIVSQEDACRYSHPVNFWNHQLASMVGLRDERALRTVRDRCVRAGWLAYDPGSKTTPASYFCVNPASVNDCPDYTSSEVSRNPVNNPLLSGENRPESGENVSTSSPIPNPIPSPERAPSHCDIFDPPTAADPPPLVSANMAACDAKFTHGDTLDKVRSIMGKLNKANANLSQWQDIIDEYGWEAVRDAARGVGPAERWPDRVAQVIFDKDKCPHPPGTDAAMNWYALHMEVK
jgi:hypothetical protein